MRELVRKTVQDTINPLLEDMKLREAAKVVREGCLDLGLAIHAQDRVDGRLPLPLPARGVHARDGTEHVTGVCAFDLSPEGLACLQRGATPCPRAKACQTLPLWAEYDKMPHAFFYGKKLVDLLDK